MSGAPISWRASRSRVVIVLWCSGALEVGAPIETEENTGGWAHSVDRQLRLVASLFLATWGWSGSSSQSSAQCPRMAR